MSRAILGRRALVTLALSVLSVTLGWGTLQAQTVLLREPLEDATGNNLTILSTALSNSSVIPGFDYATGSVGAGAVGGPYPAGIPEAPNSDVAGGDAPRTGLYMAANTTGAGANEVMALVHDPSNPSQLFTVSGDYDLQVDVWMNYGLTDSGTTEHGGVFIGHDGSTTVRPNGAGFNYTGDAGFAGDYMLFKNSFAAQASDAGNPWAGRVLSEQAGGTQYDQLLFDNDAQMDNFRVNDHSNLLLASSFCSTDCSANPNGFSNYDIGLALEPDDSQGTTTQLGFITDGAGGFRWMTIKMEVRPNSPGPAGVTSDLGFATVKLVSHQESWESTTFGDPNFGVPLDPQPDPIEVVIGVIDNSAGDTVVDLTGAVGLWYLDMFSSFASQGFNFGIFDNLIVTSVAAPGLDGDYNGDGKVDAADYVLWRKDPSSFGGDPDGYNTWVANFGAMSGAGSASLAAVPEPGTVAMAWLGLVALVVFRSRR